MHAWNENVLLVSEIVNAMCFSVVEEVLQILKSGSDLDNGGWLVG